MRERLIKTVFLSIMFVILLCGTAFSAAGPGEILSYGTDDTNIILYVSDPGDGCTYDVRIGTKEPESVTAGSIRDEEVPVRTIILLDNSLSVTEKYRQLISSVIEELAANRLNGELFTLATISDRVNYLVQDSPDYSEVRQAAVGIQYTDQETYLTDVLYDIFSSFDDSPAMRRIIIISDGVDNKSIGYTKEELYSLIEKKPCPIFTLGCTYKNNNEQLKNMFALSRITGGESYLLDDVSDAMTIVNGVAALNHTVKLTVVPDINDCDGTRKGISVASGSAGSEASDSIEITMPFGKAEVIESTPAESTAAETEPAETTPSETMAAGSKETGLLSHKRFLILGGAAVALGLILIVAITVILLSKAKKAKEERNRFVRDTEPRPDKNINVQKEHNTVLVSTAGRDENGTRMLWNNEGPHTLVLEDAGNPVKHFEASLNTPVLVGYNDECQIKLNYDRTVSGRHCRIYVQGEDVYVENLSRTNGTIMNDMRITGTAKIYSGCILVFGRLRMKVDIK